MVYDTTAVSVRAAASTRVDLASIQGHRILRNFSGCRRGHSRCSIGDVGRNSAALTEAQAGFRSYI